MLFREIHIRSVSVETISPGYFGIRYNINNNFLLDWRQNVSSLMTRRTGIISERTLRRLLCTRSMLQSA